MIRRRLVVGTALVAALLLVSGLWRLGPAMAQTTGSTKGPSGSDVVMVRCATSGSAISVGAYQGSASAPTRRSESCPETLSLLKRDGFSIESISVFDQESDYLVFTLVR